MILPRVSLASMVAQRLKCLPAMWETWVRSLFWEDPLEKEMATHSSILAWRIPWTEEPGRGTGGLLAFTSIQSGRSVQIIVLLSQMGGFPQSSVGKESACNAGDPGSVPELGRSTGEGIGYLL